MTFSQLAKFRGLTPPNHLNESRFRHLEESKNEKSVLWTRRFTASPFKNSPAGHRFHFDFLLLTFSLIDALWAYFKRVRYI